MKKHILLALALVILSTLNSQLSTAFAQGSLTPSNPPAPTMKTLDQIESRTDVATLPGDATYHHIISAPGSYYLTTNLGVTKPSGIYISATDVTLDLNGFRVRRQSGSGGIAINIGPGGSRCVVENGKIIGNFSSGVEAYDDTEFAPPVGGAYRNLFVLACTLRGLSGGSSWRFESCTAHNNTGGVGFFTQDNGVLENCAASSSGIGFQATLSAIFSRCVATVNTTGGIVTGDYATLTSCSAYGNGGGTGILTGNGSTIVGCTSGANSGSGASYGIRTGEKSTVVNCTTRGNTATGPVTGGAGIRVGPGSTVKDCSASDNAADGILLESGSTASGCTLRANGSDGIEVSDNCLITHNHATGNGTGLGVTNGAGVHATGGDNRVDENHFTFNDVGLLVDNGGNVIVRNTARDNGVNYQIVNLNKVGVIVAAPNSGPINGSTGGAGVGSTDPWANISF
jgi:hypothetical protein